MSDVNSLGNAVRQGLVLTNSFYRDLTDKTRACSKPFMAKFDRPPTMQRAGCYVAVTHYLKGMKATGTVETEAVAAKMHAMPVNHFYDTNVKIDPNGCVRHTAYVWQARSPAGCKYKWDLYKPIATLADGETFPPPGMFGCPLKGA